MHDQMTYGLEGYIRLYEAGNPDNLLFQQKNTICLSTKWLFSSLMRNSSETLYGVWGLALGSGDPSWPSDSQPAAVNTQWRLENQILRKQCSLIRNVDAEFNPVASGVWTRFVDFQTTINTVTDGISVPLREMGLIGGGCSTTTPPTVMTSAPFFDPSSPDKNTVTLINYKTHGPLSLPSGIDLILSWVVKF